MNRSGTTLIEVSVAIALAGLALSVGYAVLGVVRDLTQRTEQQYEALQKQLAVRDAIRQWLADARPDSLGLRWRVEDAENGGYPDDRIRFTVSKAAPFMAAPGMMEIAIDHDAETAERGLVGHFTANVTGDVHTIELVRSAEALDIMELLQINDKKEWMSGATPTGATQNGIELVIHGTDLPTLMRIPILGFAQ